MADEAAVKDVSFESAEKKAEAITNFDESKGSAEDLEKLMSAPVVEKPAGEPEGNAEEGSQPQGEQPAPEVKIEADATAQAAQPQGDTSFDWTKWAKDHGYKTPGEARKAFDEQKKFITEKLSQAPAARNEGYEALTREIAELKAKMTAASGSAVVPREVPAESTVSKIATVKQALNANLLKKRELITQLKGDSSLAYDPDFLEKQQQVEEEKYGLDMQLVDEINNLQSGQASATQRLTDFTKAREDDARREQGQRLYESEMSEINSFASNAAHPEFSFSEGKDSKSVEGEYVEWANKVASSLYGSNVNMLRSSQEREAVQSALERLGQNDPEVLTACQATGVSAEPSDDVRKYLDICELLDHRDGQKKNPLTGRKEQQYRVVRDPMTGAFRKDPVRFPSLEDAYNHKLAVDGTFNKRIKDAYSKGGKDMAAAAAKRATAPVVLDNAGGVGNADVGLAMTPKQAVDLIDSFDETEAQRRNLSGDRSMMDQYNKAMEIISSVKM